MEYSSVIHRRPWAGSASANLNLKRRQKLATPFKPSLEPKPQSSYWARRVQWTPDDPKTTNNVSHHSAAPGRGPEPQRPYSNTMNTRASNHITGSKSISYSETARGPGSRSTPERNMNMHINNGQASNSANSSSRYRAPQSQGPVSSAMSTRTRTPMQAGGRPTKTTAYYGVD